MFKTREDIQRIKTCCEELTRRVCILENKLDAQETEIKRLSNCIENLEDKVDGLKNADLEAKLKKPSKKTKTGEENG